MRVLCPIIKLAIVIDDPKNALYESLIESLFCNDFYFLFDLSDITFVRTFFSLLYKTLYH